MIAVPTWAAVYLGEHRNFSEAEHQLIDPASPVVYFCKICRSNTAVLRYHSFATYLHQPDCLVLLAQACALAAVVES